MGSRNVCDVTDNCRNSLLLSLAAGLALLSPAAASADTVTPFYKSERVIQSGDAAGGVTIPARHNLFVGGLSDTGQIVFSAGLLSRSGSELLIQYAGGKFTPIVMPASGPASAWPGDVYWPKDVAIARPLSMNKSGNVVFSVDHVYSNTPWATFMWNTATGHTVPVALKEMPATAGLTFTYPGGYAPAINSSNEIALVGRVKDTATGRSGYGLFRVGRDGVLEPVVRPNEDLPGGGRINIDAFPLPSIDDAGRIAFLARPAGNPKPNAYLWENGAVTPVLTVGADGPRGSKITSIRAVFLNSTTRSVVVVATTDQTGSSRYGLYRVQNGKAYLIAGPGDSLPGGGLLKTVQYQSQSAEESLPSVAVSEANSLGQRAFLATLQDGTEAAYKIDAGSGVSLIVKGSVDAQPIHITAATPPLSFVHGSRPSLNRSGQVAFSARNPGGPDMIVLLTPVKQ